MFCLRRNRSGFFLRPPTPRRRGHAALLSADRTPLQQWRLSMRSVFRSLAWAIAVLIVSRATVQAQAQARVTGHVVDAVSGQPIASAQVLIAGTNAATQTGADGQYTLRARAAGALQVRVLRVGYVEVRKAVTVADGETATLDFRMRAVPVALNPVVTTATGEQRRNEVASSIANVDAAKVAEERSISTIGDMLNSRAAGVQVLTGTQT